MRWGEERLREHGRERMNGLRREGGLIMHGREPRTPPHRPSWKRIQDHRSDRAKRARIKSSWPDCCSLATQHLTAKWKHMAVAMIPNAASTKSQARHGVRSTWSTTLKLGKNERRVPPLMLRHILRINTRVVILLKFASFGWLWLWLPTPIYIPMLVAFWVARSWKKNRTDRVYESWVSRAIAAYVCGWHLYEPLELGYSWDVSQWH